ncbi:MAG: class I SAM-dependent RNA methyltransferase, partial [Thermodesulfobacteriota bacterium]
LITAETFLGPAAGDRVIDLYCGIGAGLVRWRKTTAHVVGVELSEESVSCARQNAPGATVLRGACRHRLPQLTAALESDHARRLVYVNPPRTGLEPETAHWLATRGRPDRLAYLSCNAATLKRDLERLEAAGYTVSSLLPLDFFPYTRHLEILALLNRQ